MKYKIIGFIFATSLFMCFYLKNAYAASIENIQNLKSNYQTVFWINEGPNGRINLCSYNGNVTFSVENGRGYVYLNRLSFRNYSWYGSFNPNWSSFDPATTYTYSNTYSFNSDVQIVVLQGTVNLNGFEVSYFGTLDNWNNPTPEPLTWYQELWNDFLGFIDDNLLSILTPWEISSISNLADWFADAWTVKVGEGEDALALALASPSPVPTPIPIPTQIPYQTVMSPDGNGGYTINYIYNNPQGTPIITSSPPTQVIPTGSINITDNDFEYPYYENPDNKDNPFEFKIPWYLKLILNDNEIDIDSLDANYKVAQSQVQSDNIMDAVSSIYDGFQILPSGWLLILGAIASLPLIAALIHRMLNG